MQFFSIHSHQLFNDPEHFRKELDDYRRPPVEDRSVNDNLESTEAFIKWATEKADRERGPENRQPIPVRSQYTIDIHVSISSIF